MDRRPTRRHVLAATGAAAGASLAGCFGQVTGGQSQDGDGQSGEDGDRTADSPYAEVYDRTIGSVVLVRVYTDQGQGGGTGFVYDENYLVTNHHVVAQTSDVELQYRDGEWRSATVVGSDPYSDLAVLETEDRPEYATPLSLSTEEPAVGQEVVALGNPLGFNASVSQGIVSGVNRSLPSPTGFSIPDAIQTDAAVNPGNSGGPLVNLDGGVEGVVFSGGADNIGFAISAALAERVVPALIETGEYEHSYLGVQLAEVTPTVADVNDLDRARGVMVANALPDAPADGVLRGASDRRLVDGVPVPVGGDVIVALDDRPIPNRNALSSYLALETSPGDELSLTVLRDGEERTVELTLGSRPDPDSVGRP